ncbi:hypothetical protein [Janthinobacterium sp. RT4P48]|uniref:hypothetical protein n=1 Tax=Janthinobacterium sp. RT4P48 TaxID=3424188 RepID=UPI003F23D5B8
MTINITSNHFFDCGTGVKVDGDLDVNASGNKFVRVGKAFDISEQKSLLEKLGLPKTTDPDIVLEALAILQGVRAEPTVVQENALKGSRLAVELLSIGSNLVTVLPFLIGLLPPV